MSINQKTGVKVQNFNSPRTNSPVANQYRIWTKDGVYFQSYDSVIAFAPYMGKKQLDEKYWDFSITTGKYRNEFLAESIADTRKKIASGEYELVNLND